MALTNVLYLAELIEDKHNRDLFISKHISDFGNSHFLPIAIKNSNNFKKAWAQVGFGRLLLAGVYYAGGYARLQIVHLVKCIFPNAHAWYRKYKAGK
jgi:hypothetical protein